MQQTKYEGYVLLHNISKPKNMGMIVRNAAGFNFKKIFLIGKNDSKKKFKITEGYNFFGNQGTLNQMEFQIFETLKAAKDYFITNQITVCGIEITETSQSIFKQPFRGHTVFFMGNEGSGLLEQHKAICDQFVYIPQYSNKTASLNVAVASGIVFHHFANWAGYEEQSISGEKFQDSETLKEEQRQKKQEFIQQQRQLAEIRKKQKLEQIETKELLE